MSGIAPTLLQYLALGLVEPHQVHTVPLCTFVQVLLDGNTSFSFINFLVSYLLRVLSITLSLSLRIIGPRMEP